MRWPDAIAAHVGDRVLSQVHAGQSGAAVYRATGAHRDYFLKVGEGAAAELVADEAGRLEWLDRRIDAPRIVARADDGDATWLLMTALPGVSAGDLIKAERHRAAEVARTLAAFLRRLHALPIDDCPFDSSVAGWLPAVRRLVAEGRVDIDDFDDEHAGWPAERVLAKVEALAGHAQGRVIVHGDFSLGNIILDAEGAVVGCIDVGRLGVGDPYRDIFIGRRDLGGFGALAQRAFLDALGIDELEPERSDLHRALDELF